MVLGLRENFRDFKGNLPHMRQLFAEQARRCRAYVETRDPGVLRHTADPQEIPYPYPEKLARLLDDPQMRSVLLFVPGQEDKAAWPSHLAKGLLRVSRWIFLLGILSLIAALWPLQVAKCCPPLRRSSRCPSLETVGMVGNRRRKPWLGAG
jgi:hypothetical protein